MTRTFWITLLVVLSGFGATAENGSKLWWPQFRGPKSSGIGEGRPPVHFSPEQNVLWKTVVGSGLSSPSVWEGRIFLTEFDRTNKHLATVCIDRRTGKIRWRRTVAAEEIEKIPTNCVVPLAPHPPPMESAFTSTLDLMG